MFAPYLANQLQNAFSSFGAVGAAPQTVVQAVQPATPPVPVLVPGTAVGEVIARLSIAPDWGE